MNDVRRVRTLWDLLGFDVAHAKGGAGRIVNAHHEVWNFRIMWADGVDMYPRIVPAETLLINHIPMPEYVESNIPGVLDAIKSWKKYSFASRADNPLQQMGIDRERLHKLMQNGDFVGADKAYVTTCSFFFSLKDYQTEVANVKLLQERNRHRNEVRSLLDAHDIQGAQQYFEIHCKDWWNLLEFEEQLDNARGDLVRLQEAGRERVRQFEAARERARRDILSDKVKSLLAQGRFFQADKAHDACAEFWPIDKYLSEREKHRSTHREEVKRRWETRRLKRRERLQKKVESLLQDLHVDAADQAYEQCRAWWPKLKYDVLRNEALCKIDFLREYQFSSLRQLDEFFNEKLSGRISADEFARLKLPKLQMRLARLGMPLDQEQSIACARPEHHRLVRARAGSGKTRTLAALAALSINDEVLAPDQVLILAFNKKAAQEIGHRVREAAGIADFRNARTFHSLAWHLADHAGRKLIFDDGALAPSRREQSGFVQRLMSSLLNPAFRERLYEFFRRELEQLDRLGAGLSGNEYVAFRRSLADFTLGGETVKSNGEKFIADFLFEHGIVYKYEKVWSWDKQNRVYGTPYRPDFSIGHFGKDIILEHWAIDPLDPSAEVPGWWETTTQDYRAQIVAKRDFWQKRGIALIETHSGMLRHGRDAFENLLRQLLEDSGIHCRKLQHEELVKRVAEAPRTVSRMAELFLQFISRAKRRGWTVDTVARKVQEAPDAEPRNRIFHELAVQAYGAYEQELAEQSAMDFDDLLISAANCVREHGGSVRLRVGKDDSIALRDLRWILIDEFQDFSELYYQLIVAILDTNPMIRVVAVGDDWQAINGFAGAQLSFFNNFSDYFVEAGEATISTNRRSGRSIVEAGNKVMEDHGMPALAHHEFEGDIDVVAADKIWLPDGSVYIEAATGLREDGTSIVNWELARALKACADFIAASVYADSSQRRWMPSVLVLARTGHAYGQSLARFGQSLDYVLRRREDLQGLANDYEVGGRLSERKRGCVQIEIMTAHKAKGKEADTVIVLEAVLREFPKVHADNQLFGPFGVTAEDVLAEERRLFYVAATRAQYRLLLLTETGQESPYQTALEGCHLADGPPNSGVRLRGSKALELKSHLDQIDPKSLIMNNVTPQAVMVWNSLAGRQLGIPVVGYNLGADLHAELAWPKHDPPVAILTGRHERHAERWQEECWEVHSAGSA